MSSEWELEEMSTVRGKENYESPQAEWHELRMITLGGATGFDDTGDPQNQESTGRSSSYDHDGEDFDNYA